MTVFGMTDRGILREENQDSFRIYDSPQDNSAVAVLCDGMGGVHGGQRASEIASDAFLCYVCDGLSATLKPETSTVGREAVAYANLKVFDEACRHEALRGMGTTLVAAIHSGDNTTVLNVGDSRCYWIADGQIQQVTRDHSLVQDLLEQGKITEGEARSHPRKNVITRAIGTQRFTRCDLFRVDLREGDKLLLCSDGLSNLLTEEELLSFVDSTDLPAHICEQLIEQALSKGAPDNVTVILMCR